MRNFDDYWEFDFLPVDPKVIQERAGAQPYQQSSKGPQGSNAKVQLK